MLLQKHDNLFQIEDNNFQESIVFKVDLDDIACSCKKIIKYKMLCSHLLYAAKINKIELIEFVVKNTSIRWLMPNVVHIDEDHIILRNKSSVGKQKITEVEKEQSKLVRIKK